ncbi:MAG TPA: hypothetical protein VGV88_12780 [Candidatus Dormibacteraeota bacterium]|nr:hypothetical protein [Candidatus Dormibacteraeota bacterium]
MGVLAGCAVVLVLGGAGAGFGIYSLIQGVKNYSTTCLPSDFPRYPGSTVADEIFGVYDVYPGFTCHMVLESNDDTATVTTFYTSKLNTGSWQVTLTGDPAGTIVFQPARNASPFGTVQVASASTHTEITIDTYTSTCLLTGFPHYPGAKFAGQSFDVTGGDTGRSCHVAFLTTDSINAVMSFYKANLNAGDYRVWSIAGDQIEFRLLRGYKPIAGGTVTISPGDDRTKINVAST